MTEFKGEHQLYGRRSGIMLCYPFDERRFDRWPKPVYVQRKLDGIRCRATINGMGEVKLISSEQNEFPFLQHIKETLAMLHLGNVELDGELYNHFLGFELISGIVKRTQNEHELAHTMEYHIFDIVNEEPQDKRLAFLDHLWSRIRSKGLENILRVVTATPIFQFEKLYPIFEDYIESGYEGFIVRNKSGLYERKRSTNIMKFKPKKEDIYEIVGFKEEHSIEGIPKGSLGAFICRGDDGTPFDVGTGPALTRDGRLSLWAIKESLVGQYLKVKYQNLTKYGQPRFPVAIKLFDLREVVKGGEEVPMV